MNSREDPIIDEIRKVRHQISAAYDHDPKKVVGYYIELQKNMLKKSLKTNPFRKSYGLIVGWALLILSDSLRVKLSDYERY